jgi:pSer/pThr/pTyr-binding forkhead associated (FHA) protein
MPPDPHANPVEEPVSTPPPSRPPAAPAVYITFTPSVHRKLASQRWIRTEVRLIGRHPHNDIIVNDLGVSKQHAELRRSPSGRWSITDLNSHNGTFVNGTRVTRQELKDGDIIAIGRSAALRLAGGELIEHVDDGSSPEMDG